MANTHKLKNNNGFSVLEITIVIAIIGVILAVILGGNSMIRQVRYAKAKHLTKTAPVFEIYDKKGEPAVVAWYDASNLDNFAYASSSSFDVETWYDISGNGNHLTAYDSSQRPTWGEALLNGLPAVEFERTQLDQMNKLGGVIPYAATQATIVAVYILESNVESTLVTQTNGSGDDPLTIRIHSDLTTQTHTNTTSVVSKTLAVDVPYIFAGRMNVGTYVEACILLQNSRTCDSTAASSEMHLGAASFIISDTSAPLSADMYLAELIIFKKALIGEELGKIKQYLSSKYNIPIENTASLNY
jgi:prepilin-type N-terminal cleavage/methylation domain-containing protein